MAGRPKGAKNRRTMKVEEIADKYITSDEQDPFAVLLMVAAGDWKGLQFDEKTKISYTAAGIEFEEYNIKLADRVSAAKEAAKYLYAQKQSIALSTGDTGLKIVIEDYSGKNK